MRKLVGPEAGQEPEAMGSPSAAGVRAPLLIGDHYSGDSCQLTQIKTSVQILKRKNLRGTAKSRTVHLCFSVGKMGAMRLVQKSRDGGRRNFLKRERNFD